MNETHRSGNTPGAKPPNTTQKPRGGLSACSRPCPPDRVLDAVGGFDDPGCNVASRLRTLGDVAEDIGGIGAGRRDVLEPDNREDGGRRSMAAF